MSSPQTIARSLDALTSALATAGAVIVPFVAVAAVAVLLALAVPRARRFLRPTLWALAGTLAAGEAVLVWFHLRLWQITQVIDPISGVSSGGFAVPLWVESEKLYVWALILSAIALAARRKGDELRPLLGAAAVALTAGALLSGQPFADPLPDFLAGYRAYLGVWGAGDVTGAAQLAARLAASQQYYYNTWYMWAHPPLLFLSYGAFVASFAASILMVVRRRSSYEQVAYRWARLGYLPLTLGMVVGLPWAIIAWEGEAWWWSGKVNMSIMMWLLYTAYLHARLYLRRPGMWRVVAALAILSFVALVLTYITTYVVPGAHSVA
ncbi:MAG: cytochrome c biogenesis protein CcsA [Coriobacteriia bacterium]|nr:cytochrome c biogenesis protein CcsA [Coriobacteriia bacterium]